MRVTMRASSSSSTLACVVLFLSSCEAGSGSSSTTVDVMAQCEDAANSLGLPSSVVAAMTGVRPPGVYVDGVGCTIEGESGEFVIVFIPDDGPPFIVPTTGP